MSVPPHRALSAQPPRGFSRRGFLFGSAAVLGALAAGAAVIMRRSDPEYQAILGPAVTPLLLSVKELAVLTVLVDRLLPDRPPFPTAREVGVARRIDKELTFHGDKLASDTRAGLFVLEHGGVLHGGPRPFTSLAVDEQDARLVAMSQGSDIERQIVNGLRILALFFYYADERTWRHIGYDGPLIPESQRTPPLADSRVTKIGKV